MTFKDCIVNGQEEGVIDEGRARIAADLFDELVDDYKARDGLSSVEAERLAGKDTFDALKMEAAERRRRDLLQLKTWERINKEIDETVEGAAGAMLQGPGFSTPTGRAAKALFDNDDLSRSANIVGRQSAIKGLTHAQIDQLLHEHRRGVLGQQRNKAQLKNIVRERFGDDTGDVAAREMSSAVGEAFESLRLRFNAAGGRIGKLENFGLPTAHRSDAIRSATMKEWKKFIRPRLAPERMTDNLTGGKMSDEALELALTDMYVKTSTDGLSALKPGQVARSRSLSNRRADHRFLVFKSPAAWMEYQNRFGDPDTFGVMMAHIDSMARDIAILEILGPRPTTTLAALQTRVRQDGAKLGGKNVDKADSDAKFLDTLYQHVTGAHNSPANKGFAATFVGTRQVLQSAQLGSAALSAVTDVNFGRLAAKMNGLSQTRHISEFVKMVAADADRKKLAIRLGLIAEHYSTIASAQARYVGDVSGPEITRRLADIVMRVSGLSPWTQAGRWAFGMTFLGELADQAGKKFDQLDPLLQEVLQRNRIGPERWDIVRATKPLEHEGAKFLRPEDINLREDLPPGVAEELTTSLLEMIARETERAVPTSSLTGKALLGGSAAPGTFAGEVSRSMLMYKSFGISVLHNQIISRLEMKQGKAAYFADFLITTTLMGALAYQLKQISAGRDPQEMFSSDPKKLAAFWGAAFMQGGGLGIFGDFFFSDKNRFGGSLGETLAGPVVSAADDFFGLTVGNAQQLGQGNTANFGSDFVKALKRYTPGSSLWYLRLALERQLWNRMSEWADPKARRKQRQYRRRVERERGQKFWWAPGERAPKRGPDVSAALGDLG